MELLKDRICSMEKVEDDFYPLSEEKGIEVEYMTADSKTLDVIPAADRLLEKASGRKCSIYYPYGKGKGVSWSAASAGHAVKIKTENMKMTFREAESLVYKEIAKAGSILETFNAVLLPTAMHPWLKMDKDASQLENRSIFKVQTCVSEISDRSECRMLNYHAMHLFLPFRNDREFFRLYTAVRLILPLIPALTSSSPIIGNTFSGKLDNRLDVYKNICSCSAENSIIPESITNRPVLENNKSGVFSYNAESKSIRKDNNLCGISADFDSGIIDIGIFDIQESAHADISIARFITFVLEILVNCESGAEKQASADTQELSELFSRVLSRGMFTVVENREYLEMLGIKNQDKMSLWGIWMLFAKRVKDYAGVKIPSIENILKTGSLSERILKSIEKKSMHETYNELADCLKENKMMIL